MIIKNSKEESPVSKNWLRSISSFSERGSQFSGYLAVMGVQNAE